MKIRCIIGKAAKNRIITPTKSKFFQIDNIQGEEKAIIDYIFSEVEKKIKEIRDTPKITKVTSGLVVNQESLK